MSTTVEELFDVYSGQAGDVLSEISKLHPKEIEERRNQVITL